MSDSNGWNEYKKLILSTMENTEYNIEILKKDTDEKIRCLSQKHNECKEHTNIEIEKLKIKSQIWASIISAAVALIISIIAGVAVHIINDSQLTSAEIERMIEENIEE